MHNYHLPFKEIPGNLVRLSPFSISAPDGWIAPDNFPNCCNYHSKIVKDTEEFLSLFPLCCEQHKKFADTFNVKKSEYDFLIDKIVFQISYTQHIIKERINNKDWFEDITDFIEYNYSSLGEPAIGGHLYMPEIRNIVEQSEDISENKKKDLLEYIENHNNPKVIHKSANLNTLFKIHNKWLATFPFDISFFSHLKEEYQKKLPFVSKVVNTNRYSGRTSVLMHTEESMVMYLFNLTEGLLNQIRTADLLREGKISDPEQKRFEIILEEREIKRKTLLEKYNSGEIEYVNTITNWLSQEFDFFNKVKTFDKNIYSKPKQVKKNNPSSISFDLKYGKEDKVRSILLELNREIYLIDEEKTDINDFLLVMLSKKVPLDKKIHFKCFNNQLAYIIDHFKSTYKYYKGLSYASIGNTGIFYSKEGAKLNGQLLSSSKNQNPVPAQQETIDSIFKKFT
jgi:hypothetical protein